MKTDQKSAIDTVKCAKIIPTTVWIHVTILSLFQISIFLLIIFSFHSAYEKLELVRDQLKFLDHSQDLLSRQKRETVKSKQAKVQVEFSSRKMRNNKYVFNVKTEFI